MRWLGLLGREPGIFSVLQTPAMVCRGLNSSRPKGSCMQKSMGLSERAAACRRDQTRGTAFGLDWQQTFQKFCFGGQLRTPNSHLKASTPSLTCIICLQLASDLAESPWIWSSSRSSIVGHEDLSAVSVEQNEEAASQEVLIGAQTHSSYKRAGTGFGGIWPGTPG
ncbi:hypothetical protein HETIRDRAFT_428903 [Heterobasidion irregulare TC 32-1]|uniref:Uncharacterized protein n=1 Tax=Heterobasidion irregulare (strain TC 32-1) TaxID=747525 RepID=W4K0K5_HETIT|nr:uncharacterized protein HETIRDRAFT_428903 [Heterobasidion irregulare TC 32-1]ETW79307.1 hypothetical protein HETIRDRAFT_428903 [Heterobasidion irregulare TC 32-1]